MSPPALVHETALDAEEAARLLRGEEVGRVSVQRLFGRQQPDRLRALDLVFVPHWYVCLRAVIDAARAEHVAPALWTMVEALSGSVLRLPGEPPLVRRDLAALAPAVALPPRIGREEAMAAAKDGLRWDLRARGRLRFTPREVAPVEARLGYVPFWIGYYVGPDGQLRARAVHGVERSIQTGTLTRELLRALQSE